MEAEEDLTTEEEVRDVMVEARGWSDKREGSQAKVCRQVWKLLGKAQKWIHH